METSKNLTLRQDLAGSQAITLGETASAAVAAQAKAMVESRYVMALRNPRNWDQVRQDMTSECRRPSFANNKSTFYKKPIGSGVEGLGIRFTEMALRCMTNILVETSMTYEDGIKEVHRVSVTDLEANITYPLDIRVSKTVERSKPADDGSYISMRMNSYNKPVYTVPANDDDLLNKRNALISKAQRTLALRIIPGDLQDECEAIIKKVRMDAAAADPAESRKKIVDSFASIGVKATDLASYIGHSIDQCSPIELADLRGIYGCIQDGESTWKSFVDQKLNNDPGDKKALPQEEFNASLKKWASVIQAGNRTPDEIIATLNARYALTEEQKKTIQNLKANGEAS